MTCITDISWDGPLRSWETFVEEGRVSGTARLPISLLLSLTRLTMFKIIYARRILVCGDSWKKGGRKRLFGVNNTEEQNEELTWGFFFIYTDSAKVGRVFLVTMTTYRDIVVYRTDLLDRPGGRCGSYTGRQSESRCVSPFLRYWFQDLCVQHAASRQARMNALSDLNHPRRIRQSVTSQRTINQS